MKKLENVEECWDNDEILYVNTCGKAPESIDVFITPLVTHKIKILMENYPSLEWLAYLIGSNDDYIIEDIYIPKQKVTGVDVNVDVEERINTPIIGIIHSHHNMSATFSGIDHDGVNKNHDVSLLVTHKDMIGQVRLKTECGSYVIVQANIKPYFSTDLDVDEFTKEITDKIKKENYGYANYNGEFDRDMPRVIDRRHHGISTIDDILYDGMDNYELLDHNKVRTFVGYRDITPHELFKLGQLGKYTAEFDTYLNELNDGDDELDEFYYGVNEDE